MSAFGAGNSSFQFGQSSNTFGNSGGFGSTPNTNSGGFGTQSTTSPFGGNNNNNNNTGGSIFGASTNTSTGSFGGFGNNNNSNTTTLFGAAKPATPFGATANTSGGLFGGSSNTPNTTATFGNNSAFGSNSGTTFGSGGNSTTSAFGGFGNNNNNNTTSVFGGATQQKPLFGAGGTGTTSAFGTSTNAFGGSAPSVVGPAQGTNVVPFSPYVEKEANGTTCKYETITFQDPYKPYSLEELRLADYNGGRQFGTASGGTGAFGQTNFGSTSFTGNTGGFGSNTGGSLFGANNNATTTSTGFGGATATTGGFGSNTSGGLFGSTQNKPGGLFGQSSTAAPSGGLFGTTNNNNNNSTNTTSTFGGFGSNTNNNSGGLFGNTNTNQTQSKPGGLFGSTTNTTGNTGGFSFGNSTNNQTSNSGGLFGSNNNTATTSNTTGGLFGATNNNQQQTGSGSSLFGGTQNQNSGGLFGAKPATAFGSTPGQNQSGGLFGNNTSNAGGLFGTNQTNQNNSGGGLFGTNNTANTSGGLFGNQTQNKPGGLFGNTTTSNTGGLFANNANNNSGGLFANNANNNNQPSGGLFGTANNNTSGGLFGASQNNQNKGSLFGGNTSTNNQGSSMFGNSMSGGGLFGQSQNNQQQNPQQQEVKHASLLDPNPYGQSSIWTSLPQPTPENSKPLFTPLTATKKMQESAMKPLPSLRLNQSRYNTPPRRNGFGFSYLTYGTPSSATSTPGGASLSGSMYGNRGLSGGSFGRSFNRSASVQNLRSYYASDSDDVWKPNAFAPSHRNSSGSIKRLTIDRSIRQDLFNRPQLPALPAPKPNSNGDSSSSNAATTDGNVEPPRKLNKRVSFENTIQETTLNGTSGALVRTEQDSDEETTPPRGTNGSTEPARGNELQAVPEDREAHQVSSKPAKAVPKPDQAPGAYWMKPSRQEIAKMPREQKKAFRNFQVGRNGCGFINFDGVVDLESLNLDDIFGHIVNLEIRSATVYPDLSTKPLVGKGLNVPSTIELENSWPRNKGQLSSETSGRHYEQHIKRLKKMEGTEFISYDSARGIWKFKVPHYTTYGLDYEDDDDGMDQSELSLPPTSLENSADASVMEVDENSNSNGDDDTFAFKRSLPGGFSKHSMIEENTELPGDDTQDQPEYDDGSDRSMMSEEDMASDEEPSPHMPGSLPEPTAEFTSPVRSPLKSAVPGTPGKPLLDLEGDWAEQLQRTISPRKQNRDILREAQSKVLLDKNFSPLKPKTAPQVNFRNSMDIMNSIFLPAGGKKTKAVEPDFEFPYSKRSKTFHSDDQDMIESDRQWHESFKPHFTNSGKMLYKTSRGGDASWLETTLAHDGNSTLVLGQQKDHKNYDLASTLASCEIKPFTNLVPRVKHKKVPFSRLLSQLDDPDQSVIDVHNLAHVLFDDYEDEFTHGLTKPLQKKFKDRIRKDRLTQFLVNHISENINDHVRSLEKSDPLRAAVLRLVAKDIKGACQLLKDQRSIRLMLAVSQLDSADIAFMDAARDQIDVWRTQKSLSEIDLDIRALYEICAGNVTVCRGNEGKGVPVEDRAESFTISQRYNLDWLQCFTLGLFYGRQEKVSRTGMSTIEDAILTFQRRCIRGEEPQKPAENDAMWALLQYYASSITDNDDQDTVPHPPFPECLGSLAKPWDHSALFDFYHAMAANTTFVEHFLKVEDVVKLDQLAELLSSEFCAKGDVASAIYALIHIDNIDTRKLLIQDLLDRFGSDLPGPDTATSYAGIELWTRLTMDLKVPQSWLYMSKARYAASATNNGGDNIAELRFLVAAEAWELAHDCLLKRVAPSFTIDEDWAGLLGMCGLFGDDPARKIPGWYDGGAVYETFANLMTGQIAKNDIETISDLRKKLVTLGSRNAKTRVQLGRLGNHEREEHVAIREMANGLARLAMSGGDIGSVKEILEMPVTQDVRTDVAMCLGGEEFESIMGVGTGTGSGKEIGKGRPGKGRQGVQTGGDSEMVDDGGHGEDSTA